MKMAELAPSEKQLPPVDPAEVQLLRQKSSGSLRKLLSRSYLSASGKHSLSMKSLKSKVASMDDKGLSSWYQRVRRLGGSSSGGSSGTVEEKVPGLRSLLKKAKVEEKLEEAEMWCEQKGFESLSGIKEFNMEADLTKALNLNEVQQKRLLKRLETVKVELGNRRSTGDVAMSGKI